MASIDIVESNFAAGEVDPSIRDRKDTDLYYAGVQRARNVVARIQGGLQTRPGMRHLLCPEVLVPARFPVGSTIVYPRGALSGDRTVHTTTELEHTLFGDYVTFSGTLGQDYVSVRPQAGETVFQAVWPEIESIDDRRVSINMQFWGPSYQTANEVVLVREYRDSNGNWSSPSWTASEITLSRDIIRTQFNLFVGTGWTGIRYKVKAGQSGIYWIFASGLSIDNLSGAMPVPLDERGRIVPFHFDDDEKYIAVILPGGGAIIHEGTQVATFVGPWNGRQIAGLSFAQHLDTLFVFHQDFRPYSIQRQGAHSSWSAFNWPLKNIPRDGAPPPSEDLIVSDVSETDYTWDRELGTTASDLEVYRIRGLTETLLASGDVTISPTDDGGSLTLAGSVDLDVGDTIRVSQKDTRDFTMSDEAGWPRCGSFYQGRMVLAGSKSYPTSIWFSRSGDYQDFDIRSPENDDSGILVAYDAENVPAFHAIRPGRNLQIYADLAEVWVPRPQSGTLTPTNIALVEASERGSKRGVAVVDVDGMTAVVQRGGRSIRRFVFNETVQAYKSRSMSISAAHLIQNPVDLAYLSSPSDNDTSLLFVVDASGYLAVLAIEPDEDIAAWSRWDTNGRILDVEKLDDEVFALVQRGDSVCLEKFDRSAELDAAAYGTGAKSGGTWEHLAGFSVSVVADGRREDGIEADASGAITFPDRSEVKWEVGLAWAKTGDDSHSQNHSWVVKTLPYISRNPHSRASGRNVKRRIKEVSIAYRDGHGFWVNSNFMGLGDVDRVEDLADWSRRAQVTISGDRPVLINSINYEVSV